MPSQDKCPFCLKTIHDSPRHLDTHSESFDLRVFIFNKSYRLEEDEGGYKCPLCPFSALPYPLYTHLQAHFRPQLPSNDEGAVDSDKEDSSPASKRRIDLSARKTVALPQHQRTGSSHSSSYSSSLNPFGKRSRNDSYIEPETPTPHPTMGTPPPLSLNRHRPAHRTSLTVDLNTQTKVVSTFLNRHKGSCMLHTILSLPANLSHTSIHSCDLAKGYLDRDYSQFRAAFRAEKNPARCPSCGCPHVESILHDGSRNKTARDCKDADLQDWVIGLAFHTWTFVDLRARTFELLGIPADSFEGLEGRDKFAAWLGCRNGRNISYLSSNLLDLLFVLATNAKDVFGKFAHEREES